MTKEFNLSDQQMGGDRDFHYYSEKDVKEFIRLLKEEYMKYRDSFKTLEGYYRIFDDIDKLAGERLK